MRVPNFGGGDDLREVYPVDHDSSNIELAKFCLVSTGIAHCGGIITVLDRAVFRSPVPLSCSRTRIVTTTSNGPYDPHLGQHLPYRQLTLGLTPRLLTPDLVTSVSIATGPHETTVPCLAEAFRNSTSPAEKVDCGQHFNLSGIPVFVARNLRTLAGKRQDIHCRSTFQVSSYSQVTACLNNDLHCRCRRCAGLNAGPEWAVNSTGCSESGSVRLQGRGWWPRSPLFSRRCPTSAAVSRCGSFDFPSRLANLQQLCGFFRSVGRRSTATRSPPDRSRPSHSGGSCSTSSPVAEPMVSPMRQPAVITEGHGTAWSVGTASGRGYGERVRKDPHLPKAGRCGAPSSTEKVRKASRRWDTRPSDIAD